MLPVPIEAASAVVKAWNGLSAPLPAEGARRIAASTSRQWTSCTSRKRSVRKMPVPNSSTIVQGPNTRSLAVKTARARPAPTLAIRSSWPTRARSLRIASAAAPS